MAWRTYYTPEHMETMLRRAMAKRISPGKTMFLLIWFWGCVTLEQRASAARRLPPPQGARRPPARFPIENPWSSMPNVSSR